MADSRALRLIRAAAQARRRAAETTDEKAKAVLLRLAESYEAAASELGGQRKE